MRTKIIGTEIRARAVAGTYVVLFAFDPSAKSRKGLLGFAIHREDPKESQAYWLKGLKVFPSVVPRPKKGSRYTTLEHPVQSLIWGDYTAKPGRSYTYTVRPVYGPPKNLSYGKDIKIALTTEPEKSSDPHGVWFNRGAVASQFYADTFGNEPPPEPDNPKHKQTQWLSRGLLDACLKFIDETPKGDALRMAAYEFGYAPVLGALKEASRRGVDVKVVYEAGKQRVAGVLKKTEATAANERAIKAAGLPAKMLIKRTKRRSIPHNKFIVRLKGKTKPASVWTGSTNITASGFLGQTNVGHRIDDPSVAKSFHEYWKLLAADPSPEVLEPALDALTPEPIGLPRKKSTICIFSPRTAKSMLKWYADRILGATRSVLFTGGFGVNDTLAKAFAEDRDFLRFIMLEKPPTKKTKGLLGTDRDLKIVYGNVLGERFMPNKKGELTVRRKIPGFELTQWFNDEEHFRKRGHIFFVHTKFLIVDPLSDDPLVFTGSANFSDASLRYNDENMVLIRGNTRVADIYLTEFDRILRHFHFRDIAAETADDGDSGAAVFLKEKSNEWLGSYMKKGTFKNRRQAMFF